MNKKLVNIISGGAIAAGTIGFLLTGGTEVGAGGIVSAAAILLGAVVALWKSINDGE